MLNGSKTFFPFEELVVIDWAFEPICIDVAGDGAGNSEFGNILRL
jgi:hypothetical protein